jgi:hypothetical protein
MLREAANDASASPIRVKDKFNLVTNQYADTVQSHLSGEIAKN